MDLKRTANVEQMLKSVLFHVQSCTGVEELCWEGEEGEKKSSGGNSAAFLYVLLENHHISSCIVASSSQVPWWGQDHMCARLRFLSAPGSPFPPFPLHKAGEGRGKDHINAEEGAWQQR